MTISVVIPVFNGAGFIEEAIESVLRQSRKVDEILVVDDGSTDRTVQIVKRYADKVELLTQANAGPAVARNRGIRFASGNYIALLDADDVMLPDRIRLQSAQLDDSPEIDIVLGKQILFRQGEAPSEISASGDLDSRIRVGFVPSAALIRRGAFEVHGTFPEDQRIGDFLRWLNQAQQAGCRCSMLDTPVVLRRVHKTSLSRSAGPGYANLVAAIRYHAKGSAS
jgi:glycosyltransferase involved in cell wall biosynthesis